VKKKSHEIAYSVDNYGLLIAFVSDLSIIEYSGSKKAWGIAQEKGKISRVLTTAKDEEGDERATRSPAAGIDFGVAERGGEARWRRNAGARVTRLGSESVRHDTGESLFSRAWDTTAGGGWRWLGQPYSALHQHRTTRGSSAARMRGGERSTELQTRKRRRRLFIHHASQWLSLFYSFVIRSSFSYSIRTYLSLRHHSRNFPKQAGGNSICAVAKNCKSRIEFSRFSVTGGTHLFH
jgi:hypothetical protein